MTADRPSNAVAWLVVGASGERVAAYLVQSEAERAAKNMANYMLMPDVPYRVIPLVEEQPDAGASP